MLTGPRAIRRAIKEIHMYLKLRCPNDITRVLRFVQFLDEDELRALASPLYDDVPSLFGTWHLENIPSFGQIVDRVLGTCATGSCSLLLGWTDFGLGQFSLHGALSSESLIALVEINGRNALLLSGDRECAMRISADHDIYNGQPGVYYDIDIFGREWVDLVRMDWSCDYQQHKPMDRRYP